MHTNILKIYEEVKHYLDSTPNHKRCTLLGKDNVPYEANIPKAEIELVLYLNNLKNKLSERESSRLVELIDQLCEFKYEQGNQSATQEI